MSRYTELLEKVEDAHDWEEGPVRSGGGTQYHSTDRCRVCGITREWYSDSQNGVDESYRFFLKGEELPLREAAELEC